MTTNAKGSIGIEEKQGKYRIRLPRSIATGSSRYISTRLDATPSNRRLVQRVVFEMEDDLATGTFDPTLDKYQFNKLQPVVVSKHQKTAQDQSLLELWASYCQFIKHQLEQTTYKKAYESQYTHHIERLPTQDLAKAALIRDHLVKTLPPYTAKRTLCRVSSCCQWAVKTGIIPSNPFKNLLEDIKTPKAYTQPDPFTLQEREAILDAFQAHKVYNHYHSFVTFLFLTGCRTGEGIGLQWKHINKECTSINFCESYDSALNIRKGTKTGITRKFPCNPTLQALLLQMRPLSYKPNNFVFTSPTGNPIDNRRFTSRVWKGGVFGGKTYKGIVTQLVNEGKLDRYRCPYTTRHTFITMALEAGLTVPQVAKLVGNSPTVILKHYAGSTLKVDVPVF